MNYREMKDRKYRQLLHERKELMDLCDKWEKDFNEAEDRWEKAYENLEGYYDETIDVCEKIISKYEDIISAQQHKIEYLSEIIKSSTQSSDKSSNNDSE